MNSMESSLEALSMCLVVTFSLGISGSFGDTECIFGESDDCILPCRCLINSDGGCNKTTGLCDNDNQSCLHVEPSDTWIGHDWSGPKCQTGNVAYRKPAYLKEGGVLHRYDELTDSYLSLDKCLSLADKTDLENVVLVIDLGKKHKITSVTLHLSDGNHGFVVAVGDVLGTDLENYIRCAESNSITSNGVPIACISVGQYVSLTFTDTNLTLCEIIVTGHIYEYIDCSNCEGECYSNLYCDKCMAGFQTPGCTRDCSDGTYGYACQSECGRCQNGEACDKVTGHCDNGCEMWYIHPGTCDLYIGVANVLNNIISPNYKAASDDYIAVVVYRFRSHNTQLSWNYLLRVEYAQIHGKYSQYQDRIYEGEISGHGYAVYVRHLQPYTLYFFRLAVYRVWGDAQEFIAYSDPISWRTHCTEPSPPVLQVKLVAEEEILISWQNISTGCSYIKSVELQYTFAKGNGTFDKSKVISGTVSSFQLNIEKYERYYLKLVITNNGNLQSESEVFFYDPATYQQSKNEEQSEKLEKPCENIPVYVYGLICIIGVMLVIIIVLFLFLCRGKNSIKNTPDHSDSPVYLEAVPSPDYLASSGHSNCSSQHPYDAML